MPSRITLLFVVAAVLGLGGCFNYSEPICSFSCGTGADADLCPGNYECRSDGYCHKKGTTESCGFSDAAVSPDLSANIDQGPGDLASEAGTPATDQGPAVDQSIAD
jgi:hypothetical protein